MRRLSFILTLSFAILFPSQLTFANKHEKKVENQENMELLYHYFPGALLISGVSAFFKYFFLNKPKFSHSTPEKKQVSLVDYLSSKLDPKKGHSQSFVPGLSNDGSMSTLSFLQTNPTFLGRVKIASELRSFVQDIAEDLELDLKLAEELNEFERLFCVQFIEAVDWDRVFDCYFRIQIKILSLEEKLKEYFISIVSSAAESESESEETAESEGAEEAEEQAMQLFNQVIVERLILFSYKIAKKSSNEGFAVKFENI